MKVIKSVFRKIRSRGDIKDETLDYFLVNSPKLGRFYLLLKIHKRLHNVPGRPVISNSSYFITNISFFLDFHLKPLAHKVILKLKKVLSEIHLLLTPDREHRKVFERIPIVGFRRAKSLKDILVRAKLVPLEKKKCSRRSCGGTRCEICKHVVATETFRSFSTQREYALSQIT